MRILVSSLVFYPDHSGIALYSSDFAFYAAEQGHEVEVVTGFPFYPSWKKRKEDKGVLFRKEQVKENLKVYRGYLYVPENPKTSSRIFQELTFFLFSFLNFFRSKKPDVIVLFTTPVSLGILGWFFKKVYGSRLVINVQDFQVEAAESLGMFGKFKFMNALSKLEKFTYRNSDIVSSISDSMVDIIRDKGVPEARTYYWPNWIDVKEASEVGAPGSFRNRYDLSGEKKLIAYAGNVGLKQGLSILVDLAEKYKDNEQLHFLIIGEGGDMENLKQYHKRKGITNLTFLPFLDQKGYKEMLADVDVIFISQKKVPKDVYFPSKLLGLMAASKLIFLSADQNSELYRVLAGNDLALVSEYGDMEQMEKCVELVLNNPEKLDAFRKNAFDFVQKFDREVVLSNVLQKLEKISKLS